MSFVGSVWLADHRTAHAEAVDAGRCATILKRSGWNAFFRLKVFKVERHDLPCGRNAGMSRVRAAQRGHRVEIAAGFEHPTNFL